MRRTAETAARQTTHRIDGIHAAAHIDTGTVIVRIYHEFVTDTQHVFHAFLHEVPIDPG